MNTQAFRASSTASRLGLRSLPSGSVLPLGSNGGKLEVFNGRVWLTRAGDLDDYFVDLGQSVVVPGSGRVLVEALEEGRPALIAWHPRSLAERVATELRSLFGRCWDIVDPVRRVGAGTVAAVVALLGGALLFGPLSETRTRALLSPAAVLHNGASARTSIGLDAGTRTGSAHDVSAGTRERARVTAQEARRRPAVPA